MSESYLQPFDTILLDMNETFMFGGDRFSLSQDYYSTYQSLGGSGLSPPEVQRAINGVYSTLDAIYLDPSKHDDFPSIAETLDALPESASISSEEKKLLVETFAIHELGMIPDSYVQAIKKLSQSHKLHLISNIWSPKKRWIELFNHLGIAECFETITFSSDSRSVKPSHVLFSAALQVSDAKTCVMIGDCLRVDIARANELDFASILISPENSSREDTLRDSVQPDLIIPSLLSLLDSQEQQDSSSLAIEDESIRIRETRDSDLKFVLDAENDIENSPFVVSWSMDQHRESLGNSDVGHLIIENVKTTCPVGYAIVRGLAAANGPIELKRLVITEKRMGHGRATLTLLKELVFKRLGRARFWLNVLPHNRRALDLYHSTGFRYEGTWRDSYPTDSVHLDLILMTSLATDDFENRSLEFSGKSVKVVRQFSQRQLAQYCELYDLEWPNNTRTHDDLVRGLLGAKFAIGITEEESDDLIAICSVISDREFRAWIHGVIVRKDHRGIGLGKLLMEQVLSSFETQHYHHICLTCAPGMTDFYSRWGFKVWKDEAVMKLLLREPTTDS